MRKLLLLLTFPVCLSASEWKWQGLVGQGQILSRYSQPAFSLKDKLYVLDLGTTFTCEKWSFDITPLQINIPGGGDEHPHPEASVIWGKHGYRHIHLTAANKTYLGWRLAIRYDIWKPK